KILGAIVGAAAVAPLVLLFRLEDLLVLWALTLAATLAIVVGVARTVPAAPIERRVLSLRDELFAGFRVVRASPLLRWLAIALVLTDSFLVIAASRWLQLAWLAGIADAAYQALFNPVPPERRDQMRAFMEGVPGQAGIALAGLLLIFGDRAFEPRQVALAGVV